ncbi:acyl transferase, partial [Tuber indicum]
MTWRSFGVGDNISTAKFTLPVHIPKTRAPVLAVFSGQGPQAACMGRSLFMRYSVFRDSIMKSDKILRSYAGFSLVENTMLFRVDSPPGLSIWPWPIMVNTMAIIFCQVALYDLMCSFDVKPDIIIGYSMGEVAAMYASGALTHEAVIQLMWESGESFLAADGRGAMAAAMCSAGEAENILTRVNGENPLTARLTVSCFDSPKGVLVAGYSLGIKKFLEALARLKIPSRELKVRMAAHSLFLDSFKEEYLKRLKEIFEKQEGNLLPLVPVISTVTGQRVLEPYTPDYIWRNI